jgi:outer membrane protein assembly factor BamB
VVPLQTGRLTAHRINDGDVIWTTDLTPEQPLAADDHQVYVASGEHLHAIDATTGAIAWRFAAGGPLTAPPVARGGWVLAAVGGELVALRSSDGALVWREPLGAIEFRPALDGDLLIVPLVEGFVVALDLEDGQEQWKQTLGSAPGEPFVIGDRVYVGTQDKSFYTLFASDGRIASRSSVGAVVRGRATVDNRHVYFAAMDNMLRAVSRRTGNLQWKQGLPYRPAAGPVLIGTVVLVPGYIDKPLPVFDAATGASAGSVPFPATLIALPVLTQLSDGTPVIIGVTGNLDNKIMVSMFEPKLVAAIAVQPLTVLPGEVVPLPPVPR